MIKPKINFPIVFSIKEIKEAHNKIPDINDSFCFFYNDKKFDVNILSSFLISDKVKEEIMTDCTRRKYKLKNTNYNERRFNNNRS